MARHPKRSKATKRSSSQKQGTAGAVRIVGGDWRGRKLPVLVAEGLRPTSDRVRETLFNWLQFEIPGGRCLDLFAGSGALGFEALSRGAKTVTFVELNPENARQLEANARTLKTQKAEVVQTDGLQWLKQSPERAGVAPFDVVFLDPPFNQALMQTALDLLFENGWLDDEQSCLYLEQEKERDWPEFPPGWHCAREKCTSQVKYSLWRRAD